MDRESLAEKSLSQAFSVSDIGVMLWSYSQKVGNYEK